MGRRRAMTGAVAMVAALAAGSSLVAAGAAPAAGEATRKPVTFTVGIMSKPDSLNPYTGLKITSYEIWRLMYQTLNFVGPVDGTPQPALASSWESSDDQRVWTYHLVDDAKWSDGTPLTSKDVKYSLDAVIDGGPEA